MAWWLLEAVGELVVSVLGKTVGRRWMDLGNSVGWGVVLEERER